MTDFTRILTEEQRRTLSFRNDLYAEQNRHAKLLTDENLVATVRYYMGQMSEPRWKPGEPVYDGVLWHVMIPELLLRLGQRS